MEPQENDPVPPSGEQIELVAGEYRAVVASVGGGIRTLEHDGRALLDGYAREEICEGARGQLLVPWPNRVADGRYEFRGSSEALELSEPERGCAIHGLARWASWQVAERAGKEVRLTHRLHPHPGYPHVLDLSVSHRLDAELGLEIELTAVNRGAGPAPFGVGMHPYLTAGTPRIDSCELTIPAATWLPTDERGIPRGSGQPVAGTELDFRAPRTIGQTRIDFAFTDLLRDTDGRATLVLTDPRSGRGSCLWVDESLGWLEVFTGDHLPSRQREGLGTEPMSCPPNAFVSGIDVQVLGPGQSHRTRWGIRAA